MKQCREHNCPLQDICRGAVDNSTWWNISDDCEIFSFVNAQADKIFALENRIKECENGYEGTLFLDRCKLHDAEEKVKELTQANDMLSESYDHLEKAKDNLLSERARLTAENERLSKEVADLQDELKCEKETNAHLCSQYMSENHLRHQAEEMLANGMSAVKTDTVREMCQRIKEYFPYDADSGLYVVLDQIAKEMLEGEK